MIIIIIPAQSGTIELPAGYSYDRAWLSVAGATDIVMHVIACKKPSVVLATYMGVTAVSSERASGRERKREREREREREQRSEERQRQTHPHPHPADIDTDTDETQI